MFEAITASSIMKVDSDGSKGSEQAGNVNPAGFLIHSAIHRGRPDVHCGLHIHSADGIAVASQEKDLLALAQQTVPPPAPRSCHGHDGVVLTPGEQERSVKDLRVAQYMPLRNHCPQHPGAHAKHRCALDSRAACRGGGDH